KMNFQTAAGRTKAADHVCSVVRFESRGHFAEAKIAWLQDQVPGKFAVPLSNQRFDFLEKRMFPYIRGRRFHDAIAPGILGGTTAVKNRYRSNSSPNSEKARIPAAVPALAIPVKPTTGRTTPPSRPKKNRAIVARFNWADKRIAVRFMGVQSASWKC